jgi:hypothetical protein
VVTLALVLHATTAGGQLLLVAAVLRRLRSGPPLVAVLRAHTVLPGWARSAPAATAIEAAQVAAGVVGAAALLAGSATAGQLVASNLVTATLFASFTGYLPVVLRRRGPVPCGCFGGDEPVRPAAIARAAAFTAAPVAALPVAGDITRALAAWPTRLGVLAGAVLIAALAVHLVSLANTLGHDRTPSAR